MKSHFLVCLVILVVLFAQAASARCLRSAQYIVEIQVEACLPIEGEKSLLVIGKLVGFIEFEKYYNKELEITRIESSEEKPSERYVWKQTDGLERDCNFIEKQKPFLARSTKPCCDTLPHRSYVCQHSLRIISEIIYKDMPENAHNKAFKFVPALRASTGPKKAAPFWAA